MDTKNCKERTIGKLKKEKVPAEMVSRIESRMGDDELTRLSPQTANGILSILRAIKLWLICF